MGGRKGGGQSSTHTLDPVRDTGYTAVCPVCATRYQEKPEKIGKNRDIESKLCDTCKALKRTIVV